MPELEDSAPPDISVILPVFNEKDHLLGDIAGPAR